jgi:hypothetical protein
MNLKALQQQLDVFVAEIADSDIIDAHIVPSGVVADGRIVIDLVNGTAITDEERDIELPYAEQLKTKFSAMLVRAKVHPRKIESAVLELDFSEEGFSKVVCEALVEGKRFSSVLN